MSTMTETQASDVQIQEGLYYVGIDGERLGPAMPAGVGWWILPRQDGWGSLLRTDGTWNEPPERAVTGEWTEGDAPAHRLTPAKPAAADDGWQPTPDPVLGKAPRPGDAEGWQDKAEGLAADLASALDVLWRRGDDEAREWCRLNYRRWADGRSLPASIAQNDA